MTEVKGKVPAPKTGQAETVQAYIQPDLAQRTWDKIQALLDGHEMGQALHPDNETRVLAALRESFREANCDATLYDVQFWDLSGQQRIKARNTNNEEVIIPVAGLPAVGSIITWDNRTYYIGSHHNVEQR